MAAPRSMILIRHAHAEPITDGEAGAQQRRPLSVLGRDQAERLTGRLVREVGARPIRLFTSPYRRCRQTAEPIAAAFGVEAIADPRLREYDVGAANDLTTEQRGVRYPEWFQAPPGLDGRPVPDGETWREFLARCAAFLEDLPADGPLPIVVGHGGTIDNLVALWLRLPPAVIEGLAFLTPAASISIVRTDAFGNRLLHRLGDIAHLAGAEGWDDLGSMVG
jgi:broad specificity phosphatase PhoE